MDEEISVTLGSIEHYLSSLSQPLKDVSLQFFHLHKEISFIRDGILFPFWVSESLRFKESRTLSLLLSESNVYGFFYVRLNDYIQDGFTLSNSRSGILGCLFWNKMLHNYRMLFNHDSPFWHDFDDAVLEYCHAKASEFSHHVFPSFQQITDEMLQFDAESLGKKSSLLKLCLYAYVHLSNSEKKTIRAISQLIDHYNTGLQLLDDIQDWRQDIEHHRINAASAHLIERIRESSNIGGSGELNVERLTGFATMVDFQEVYEKAVDQLELALAQCRELEFHKLEEHLTEELLEARRRMVQEREAKERMRKAFHTEEGRTHD